MDHSYAALKASLDRSMERLGGIDVLQLHKTTPEVLRGAELGRAWEYAAALGITVTGPSVSDLESARITLENGYRVMQLPYNMENTRFEAVIDAAAGRGMRVMVNRPFAMGKILYDGRPEDAFGRMLRAFRFILARRFQGVLLSGTSSAEHLAENWRAFGQANGDAYG